MSTSKDHPDAGGANGDGGDPGCGAPPGNCNCPGAQTSLRQLNSSSNTTKKMGFSSIWEVEVARFACAGKGSAVESYRGQAACTLTKRQFRAPAGPV